jgi:hypothetical protein
MLKIVIPERRRHACAFWLCRKNERRLAGQDFFGGRAFIPKAVFPAEQCFDWHRGSTSDDTENGASEGEARCRTS